MKGRYLMWLPPEILAEQTPLVQTRKRMLQDGYIILPNLVPNEGKYGLLEVAFQSVATNWAAAGGNFYVGLCNQAPTATDGLADITSEPGATGGYARQAVARSAVGWPTTFNNNAIRSAQLTFSASGADFDTAFTRAFLTTVVSGTSGVLLSVSAALTAAVILADGLSYNVAYEFYLD